MTLIMILYAVAIFMTPNYRELITKDNYNYIKNIIFLNQSIVYWCGPKVLSPFINYIIGKSIHGNGRTAVNSLTYVLQLFLTAFTINLMTPLYTWSMESEFALGFKPFNKNLVFLILVTFVIGAIVCLNKTKY